MKASIRVSRHDGPPSTITAVVYGIWAVHRKIDGVAYVVTHIPTGLQVSAWPGYKKAKGAHALARVLNRRHPTYMATCETWTKPPPFEIPP